MSVVAAAPIGITTTYDANGDHRRRRYPHGAVMSDVMMTMVGKKGGEVTGRRQQGNGEATARRRQGNSEVTTRQRQGNKDEKAISYGAAGGRGNKAIDKRITHN